MSVNQAYSADAPSRSELDQTPGPLVVEFGTDWCGHCRGAQPLIEEALAGHRSVKHLKIEDGKGRRLGRSFKVKLWPTLVFMRDGEELARVVRPGSARDISDALDRIDTPA